MNATTLDLTSVPQGGHRPLETPHIPGLAGLRTQEDPS